MIQRFKTKPVEIDAIQFTGKNYDELIEWTEDNFRHRPVGERLVELATQPVDAPAPAYAQVYDMLHTTWINVLAGQWIVKGAKGEFYPCDDETFLWKYEEVL